MRKILTFALIGGLFATAAHADFTGKDASLATITFKNPGTCTSVVCVPIFSLFDPSGTNGAAVNTAGADGVSNTANGLLSYGRNLVFNGTTWDRWQGAVTVSGVSTATNQTTINTSIGTTNTNLGAPGATVCATDTGSCSLNALFQRALQTLTTIGTNTGAAIPAGTAIIGKVGIDQTTPGTTNGVAIVGVNGATALAGSGATGTGSPRVTTAVDQATNAGAALVKGGVGVVNGGSTYQAVAASQTATVLQTSTGATGDYLSHCVIYPTSTSPGVVTVFDNTNTAATSAILFAGGATSTSNLTPISVPVGAVSTAGAWKVTTGAAVSVVCYGKFS